MNLPIVNRRIVNESPDRQSSICNGLYFMVLVAVDDLMFSSRISTAARAAGTPIRFTRSVEAVLEAARAETPSLVVLDLNSARVRPLEIVAAVKADPGLAHVPLLGFVSHVDAATIEAARSAGVDRVLARSAFVAHLPELLRGASAADL
jgi:CheY-like chemotaxis protein